MKAIVLVAPGEVRIVGDWPEPVHKPDEVVVQLRGVGLCGTDLAVYDGRRPVPAMPWVMGHEGGGDIVAVGSEVTDRQVGQRVIIEPNYFDGDCPACQAGWTSACLNRKMLGVTRPGLLAEQVAVPARLTWPAPEDWPDEYIVCFQPLAVAYTAVRRAGVGAGDDCLVVGAGPQGLLVTHCLVAVGARPYVVEPHEGRLLTAERLGARRASDFVGKGYPFGFEASGASSAWEPTLAAMATKGTLVLIGLNNDPVKVTPRDLILRQLTIRGALFYDHPDGFAATFEAVNAGRLIPDRVIRAGFPVEGAAAAFAEARNVPGKSWIMMTDWS